MPDEDGIQDFRTEQVILTLPQLMHIAIEGPDLSIIDFQEILEVFKEPTDRIQL